MWPWRAPGPPMSTADFNSRATTITLSIVLLSVVFTMLAGLFDDHVKNDQIFSFLGPGFSTILGYFVGRREGQSPVRRSANDNRRKPAKTAPKGKAA